MQAFAYIMLSKTYYTKHYAGIIGLGLAGIFIHLISLGDCEDRGSLL